MSAELSACPECLQGKHGNCDGTTWDVEADDSGVCPCWAADHVAPLGVAVLGEVAECNGHCNHDGADRDCPIHGEHADNIDQQRCGECGEWSDVVEVFDDQIGFEEQARPVVVTRLACGGEIVEKGRWSE